MIEGPLSRSVVVPLDACREMKDDFMPTCRGTNLFQEDFSFSAITTTRFHLHNIIKQCVFVHVDIENIIMRCHNS